MKTNTTPTTAAPAPAPKAAHTPEPLVLGCRSSDMSEHSPRGWCLTSGGKRIANIPDAPEVSENEQADNAARIVACVNACAGMHDPAAEIACLRGRSDGIPAMCAEVETLRAALASARHSVAQLRAALADLADGHSMAGETRARALLAKGGAL